MLRSGISLFISIVLVLAQLAISLPTPAAAQFAGEKRNPNVYGCNPPNHYACYQTDLQICTLAWGLLHEDIANRARRTHLSTGTPADELLQRVDNARREANFMLCNHGLKAVEAECDRLSGVEYGPNRGPLVPWDRMDAVRVIGFCTDVEQAGDDEINSNELLRAATKLRLDYEEANGPNGIGEPGTDTYGAFSEIGFAVHNSASNPYAATLVCLLSPAAGNRLEACETSYKAYRLPSAAAVAGTYIAEFYGRSHAAGDDKVALDYLLAAKAGGVDTSAELARLEEYRGSPPAPGANSSDNSGAVVAVVAVVAGVAFVCFITNCLGSRSSSSQQAGNEPPGGGASSGPDPYRQQSLENEQRMRDEARAVEEVQQREAEEHQREVGQHNCAAGLYQACQ